MYPGCSLLPFCLSLKCTPSLDNTDAMLIFMLEPEVDVKGSTHFNPQHSSCQCSRSLVQGKRVYVLTEEMWGLFTCLFQEGEQGVSSEQRVAGQMASQHLWAASSMCVKGGWYVLSLVWSYCWCVSDLMWPELWAPKLLVWISLLISNQSRAEHELIHSVTLSGTINIWTWWWFI